MDSARRPVLTAHALTIEERELVHDGTDAVVRRTLRASSTDALQSAAARAAASLYDASSTSLEAPSLPQVCWLVA